MSMRSSMTRRSAILSPSATKVRIIPVHICPVCNLYERAYLISGDEVVQELDIAARGKLQ